MSVVPAGGDEVLPLTWDVLNGFAKGEDGAPALSTAQVVGEVFRRLSGSPANVSADDASTHGLTEGYTLWKWEDVYWRLDPDLCPAGVARRLELGWHEYAELEALRIAALLALPVVGGLAADLTDEGRVRRYRAQSYLYRWLHEVMGRGEDCRDVYFETHRSRDSRTYSHALDQPAELFVTELEHVLFSPDGNLRSAFAGAGDGSLLPDIHEWMFRRYEFQAARRVRDAIGGHVDAVALRRRLPMRLVRLPRLCATVAVGHFALLGIGKLWVSMVSASQHPLVGVPITGAIIALYARLILHEVDERAARPPWRYRATLNIVGASLGYSLAIGAMVSIVADVSGYEAFETLKDPWQRLLLVPIVASVAMCVGYLLQVLWDDKPISDRL